MSFKSSFLARLARQHPCHVLKLDAHGKTVVFWSRWSQINELSSNLVGRMSLHDRTCGSRANARSPVCPA